MLFLERPIDYAALRAVLLAFSNGPSNSAVRIAVAELEALVDEAERAFAREPWDERILRAWSRLEAAVREDMTARSDANTLALDPEHSQ